HRADEADVVDMAVKVGQPVGNPRSIASRLVKRKLSAQHLWHPTDEGEALPFEKRRGAIEAVEFLQVGLVVEELELARRSGHVKINHPPGFCGELRRQRGEG